MPEPTTNNTLLAGQSDPFTVTELLDRLSAKRHREWYQERQWRKNIENGQSYFNGPGTVPESERHSPSQLLQCHRKIVYRQENAPAEQPDPRGIFWFGTKFEEDLLFPFLDRAVTGMDTYVQNSIWIDFTIETEVGELRIKGSTDPVIVDPDAVPILLTEIKTKDSISNVTEPNCHHRAQVHAYLAGLSEKFDEELTDAAIVYGSRESLDVKTFHVSFDEEFWQQVVLDWASTHTQYRIDNELPPAEPEYDWECRFCSYRNRCGKGDSPHSDLGSNGLIPRFNSYPRRKVIEYLEAHPEERLTPTLAHQYPGLVDAYGVSDFYCSSCESEIGWQAVDTVDDPFCPQCVDRGTISILTVPISGSQSRWQEDSKEQNSL